MRGMLKDYDDRVKKEAAEAKAEVCEAQAEAHMHAGRCAWAACYKQLLRSSKLQTRLALPLPAAAQIAALHKQLAAMEAAGQAAQQADGLHVRTSAAAAEEVRAVACLALHPGCTGWAFSAEHCTC